MRRPWGLRITECSAAAGAIALVSAITFGLCSTRCWTSSARRARPGNVTRRATRSRDPAALAGPRDRHAGLPAHPGPLVPGPVPAARRELPRQLADPRGGAQRRRPARTTAELRRELAAYTSYLEDVIGRADASAVTAPGGPAPVRRDPRDGRRSWTPPSAASCSSAAPRRGSAGALDRRRRRRARRPAASWSRSSPSAPCAASSARSTGCRASRASSAPAATAPACPSRARPRPRELAQAFNPRAETGGCRGELRRIGERHLAELDAVFRESPLGLAFVDLDLRFLRVNEALARMNRRPPPSTSAEPWRGTGQHDVGAALRG